MPYLAVVSSLVLVISASWWTRANSPGGGGTVLAEQVASVGVAHPPAAVLLRRMEAALQGAAGLHLAFTMVETVPQSPPQRVLGQADVSPRHHRATWKERLSFQSARASGRTAHTELIENGSRVAQRVALTPWLCTDGRPDREAFDPMLGYHPVAAKGTAAGTLGRKPVWRIAATVAGSHGEHGTATFIIARSNARLLRLKLKAAGRSSSGASTFQTISVAYSQYGERVMAPLPAACRYLPIDPAGVEPFTVEGDAMAPTLLNGQMIWVDRLAYRDHPVRRGDIIVFRAVPAQQPNKDFIKRVIGLPGETVAVHHHSVYINGRRLYEPYVRSPADYRFPALRVPAGQYFVLGDNRNNSFDSHIWSFLPAQDIIGRALLSP